MLNRVILIGRLTADPVLSYTQSGKAVTKFALAVDRGTKGQDGQKETDFIDIRVWDKQAENVSTYVKKEHKGLYSWNPRGKAQGLAPRSLNPRVQER
jgi:single stranded DNA-binding protein